MHGIYFIIFFFPKNQNKLFFFSGIFNAVKESLSSTPNEELKLVRYNLDSNCEIDYCPDEPSKPLNLNVCFDVRN
jgi:hypothetical protein